MAFTPLGFFVFRRRIAWDRLGTVRATSGNVWTQNYILKDSKIVEIVEYNFHRSSREADQTPTIDNQ